MYIYITLPIQNYFGLKPINFFTYLVCLFVVSSFTTFSKIIVTSSFGSTSTTVFRLTMMSHFGNFRQKQRKWESKKQTSNCLWNMLVNWILNLVICLQSEDPNYRLTSTKRLRITPEHQFRKNRKQRPCPT